MCLRNIRLTVHSMVIAIGISAHSAYNPGVIIIEVVITDTPPQSHIPDLNISFDESSIRTSTWAWEPDPLAWWCWWDSSRIGRIRIAEYSHILPMSAVVTSPSHSTLFYCVLMSTTPQIVQPNTTCLTNTTPLFVSPTCVHTTIIPSCSAKYTRIPVIETVVTNCTPCTIVEYLNMTSNIRS